MSYQVWAEWPEKQALEIWSIYLNCYGCRPHIHFDFDISLGYTNQIFLYHVVMYEGFHQAS